MAEIIEEKFDAFFEFLDKIIENYEVDEDTREKYKNYLKMYENIDDENESGIQMNDNIHIISYQIHDEWYDAVIKDFEFSSKRKPLNESWILTNDIFPTFEYNDTIIGINISGFARSIYDKLGEKETYDDLEKLHGHVYTILSLIESPRMKSFYKSRIDVYFKTSDKINIKKVVSATAAKLPEITAGVKEVIKNDDVKDIITELMEVGSSGNIDGVMNIINKEIENVDNPDSIVKAVAAEFPSDLIEGIVEKVQ